MRISHFIYPDAPPGSESGVCALCGYEGSGQYRRDDVLDILTSNVTAIFELRYDHICGPCYGLWSKPKHWHRGILATPGQAVFPVISNESATEERPTWSQAFRSLQPEQPRAIILTTDPKKRVWPFARVSSGPVCSIYIHDPSRGISENSSATIPRLRQALNLVEQAYSFGFSKPFIARSLIGCQKAILQIGLDAALALEHRLSAIRNEPEFLPALIVAQKEANEPKRTATIPLCDDGLDAARPR